MADLIKAGRLPRKTKRRELALEAGSPRTRKDATNLLAFWGSYPKVEGLIVTIFIYERAYRK